MKTEFKNAYFYMYYEMNGKLKYKRLPFRSSKQRLINTIEKIRAEIDYYNIRKKRIEAGFYDIEDHKPAWFVSGENYDGRKERNKACLFSSG